ncbi:MAG: DUF547 domain-containing protein [Saprospiraceae bacterium]|nr:DUF547 domain-containing protein [Saprospiraceae bacterium]
MKLVLILLIHLTAFCSCKKNPGHINPEDTSNAEVIDETSSEGNNESEVYTDTIVTGDKTLDTRGETQDSRGETQDTRVKTLEEGQEKTLPRPEPEVETGKIEQVDVEERQDTRSEILDTRSEMLEEGQEKTLPRPEPEVQTGKLEQVEVEETQDTRSETQDTRQKTKDQEGHEIFNALLRKNVSGTGKVNYEGFKSEESRLEAYLAILESTEIAELKTKEQLAFWINAYNAYTIKLIMDNYPLASIMDLDGGKVWDRKWIKLDGWTLSLNNIENDIIRPGFKEPRIHFAVNCAAKSCPPLANQAWTAENMERMFEKQTRDFINNPEFNEISKSRIRVSRIFDWYKTDFGNLIAYLNKYSGISIDPGANIDYLDYDWSLNN